MFISTKPKTKVIKVKGISSSVLKNVKIHNFASLLLKNLSMEFTQEKWFKSLYEGKIRVSDVAYQLKVTSNKRKNIYVTNKSNGKTFWPTEPYFYHGSLAAAKQAQGRRDRRS